MAPGQVQMPHAVAALLMQGERALRTGDTEDALRCVLHAAVTDIRDHACAVSAKASSARGFGACYEQIFQRAGVQPRAYPPVTRERGGDQLRVLFVLFQAQETQAASRRLSRLLPQMSAEIQPSVLVSEEFTQVPTIDRAPSIVQPLRDAGIHVQGVGVAGSWLERGAHLTEAARSFEPDVTVFIASPACAVQAHAAYARVAPVQINHNIAAPLVLQGIDAILYHHPPSEAADRAALSALGIESMSTAGPATNVRSAHAVQPRERDTLGVPRDGVAFCTVSNQLNRRACSGGFADGVAAFLRAHPRAHWVGVGEQNPEPIMHVMQRAGVSERVHFIGPTDDPRSIIAACDVYLNEYPEGGCNAVIEAMSVGTPAVAMRAGDAHVCRVGSDVVGHGAIQTDTPSAYWALAAELLEDQGARDAASKRQRVRAVELFSDDAVLAAWEQMFWNLTARAGGRCASSGAA